LVGSLRADGICYSLLRLASEAKEGIFKYNSLPTGAGSALGIIIRTTRQRTAHTLHHLKRKRGQTPCSGDLLRHLVISSKALQCNVKRRSRQMMKVRSSIH